MKSTRRHVCARAAAIAGLVTAAFVLSGVPAARAEVSEVRIGVQFGLTYLPFVLMEDGKLIEKQAKAAGLGDVKASYFRSAGGTAMNDALLSNSMDFAATGIPSFLHLWAKGKGKFDVRAISSYGYSPLVLLTRNPAVKTIKDFTEADRIAVPAVRSSIQAMLLQMAAEKAFGPGNYDKLDALTVSRAHPDAMVAMISGKGEINSHFSVPPFFRDSLKTPGIHAVITAEDIFGGPVSNGVMYLPEKFYNANPKTVAAVLAALSEAIDMINRDKRAAAEVYLRASGQKTTVETILETVDAPGTHYDLVPRGVGPLADFMQRTGSIAIRPASWKDLFFKEAHGLPGS